MLAKEPMSMTGLPFLGFHILSGLVLERISDKNPEDKLEPEGWIDRSKTPSRSVGPVVVLLPPPGNLPHGQQPMSLTKHGLWKRDPQERHFSASASWS